MMYFWRSCTFKCVCVGGGESEAKAQMNSQYVFQWKEQRPQSCGCNIMTAVTDGIVFSHMGFILFLRSWNWSPASKSVRDQCVVFWLFFFFNILLFSCSFLAVLFCHLGYHRENECLVAHREKFKMCVVSSYSNSLCCAYLKTGGSDHSLQQI